MYNETYSKNSLYEILIKRSLTDPESIRHFKAVNAYYYLSYLMKQGNEKNIPKQSASLKSYLSKAIQRLTKKTKGKSKKQQLQELTALLEPAGSLSQIDWIVEQTLELIRSKEQSG